MSKVKIVINTLLVVLLIAGVFLATMRLIKVNKAINTLDARTKAIDMYITAGINQGFFPKPEAKQPAPVAPAEAETAPAE